MNIVFAGTPAFGLPCLEALHQSKHQLLAVYTQPDRPSGRGRKVQPSPIKAWATTHDIAVYQPVNFKSAEAREALASLKPDLIVVIAYGLILPQAVLDIPRFGCVNVHASLLPKWRGASPIQHAILNGDTQSGVTIMQMDAGMDTGSMYTKVECPIHPEDTTAELHDRLAAISSKPLLETINAIASGSITPETQDDAYATYAPKINKVDAKIDWRLSAVEILNKIRAYSPWPICFTQTPDTETLRIHQASLSEAPHNDQPGTILSIDKRGIQIAAGTGSVILTRIQWPGGKPIAISDWLNANRNPLKEGQRLS